MIISRSSGRSKSARGSRLRKWSNWSRAMMASILLRVGGALLQAEGLNGDSYGEALRWMNRLMASLQAMEGSSNKWGMWGLNTTKIDEKIEKNMERIDEILEGLGENKPDDAKGIAEEGLDDMKNPGKWAHGPDKGQGHGGGSDFPWGNWWDHGVFNGHGNGKGGK